MANEVVFKSDADITAYFVVLNASGQAWQTTTSTFVAIVDANWANYDVALVEQGTSSGVYVGSFPTGITTPGTYSLLAYKQLGGTPAVSDTHKGQGTIVWSGTAEVLNVGGGSASTTLAEATRILTRAARTGADDARYTTTDLHDAIKAIGNDFVRRTRCVRQLSTVAMTASTLAVSFSGVSGFDRRRIGSIGILKDANYSYAQVVDGIEVVTPDEIAEFLAQRETTGVPTHIGFTTDTSANLWPIPRNSGTLNVWWHPHFTTFTSGTSDAITLNIPDDIIHPVLTDGAVALLQSNDMQAALKTLKGKSYEEHVLRCKGRGSSGARSIGRMATAQAWRDWPGAL